MKEYEIELEDGTTVILESEWEKEPEQRGGGTDPSWPEHWVCVKEGRTWIMVDGLRVLVDEKTYATEDGKKFGEMIQRAELALVESL